LPYLDLYDCQVDIESGLVTAAEPQRLSTMEAKLLGYLAERPSQVVSNIELLEQVWGYSGTTHTRTITTTVGRLRAKIERDRKSPSHIITVIGEGYRFEPKPSPATEGGRARTNLRPNPLAFFGRTDTLLELGDAIQDGGLVTLCGAAGSGKTRTVLEFSASALERSQLAQLWFCDLQQARTTTALLVAVGDLLGLRLPDADPSECVDRVGHALEMCGPTLLILDNFEQLPRNAANAVVRWLDLAPQLKVVVTSRHQLLVPNVRVVSMTPMSEQEAVRMFDARARRSLPEFDIERERSQIADVVRRLDYLPLAIELAAAWASTLSPGQLLQRIDKRFTLLADDAGQGRHATLRHALDASWELLSEHERIALRQCSTFRDSFDLAAAEAVVALDDDAPWTPAVLRSLHHKSLLDVDSETQRFRLSQSVWAYVEERVPDAERRSVVDRHRDWYLDGAERWGQALERGGDTWAQKRIDAEFENLLAVFERCLPTSPDTALRIVLALETYLNRRGPVSAHKELLRDVLARPVAPALRVEGLYSQAYVRFGIGDAKEVLADLEECVALAETLNDPALLARAQTRMGGALWTLGQPERGLVYLENALGGHVASGDGLYRAQTLWYLGKTCQILGRHDDGAIHAHSALAHAELESLSMIAADSHWMLGTAAIEGGRFAEARTHLDKARQLDEANGHRTGLANVHVALGDLTRSTTDLDAATAHYQRAKDIFGALGHDFAASLAGIRIATLLCDLGQLDAAEEALATERIYMRRAGSVANLAAIENHNAKLAMERGDTRLALDILERAQTSADAASPVLGAVLAATHGRATHLDGRPAEAALGLRRALDGGVVADRHRKRFGVWLAAALADAGDVDGARAALRGLAPEGDTELPFLMEFASAHIAAAEGLRANSPSDEAKAYAMRNAEIRLSMVLLNRALGAKEP